MQQAKNYHLIIKNITKKPIFIKNSTNYISIKIKLI